jgi:small subunit ribosomal protein S8
MAMTDPVADLLTRIRNAVQVSLDSVEVPASRMKASIVKVLRDEGFIKGFKIIKEDGKASIKIYLKYGDDKRSVITGIQRISRPGLRRYVSYKDLPKVRSGTGVSILSTSKGVLSGAGAKTQHLGGEYICEVW